MHIIITDSKHGRVRSFELGMSHVLMFVLGVVALLAAGVWAWLSGVERSQTLAGATQQVASAPLPSDSAPAPNSFFAVTPTTTADADVVQQNIDALAKRLGIMQARMIQLQALSERLANIAGLPPPSEADTAAGEGGVLVEPRSMSVEEFSSALEALTREGEERLALLSVVEDSLLRQSWADALKPGLSPVDGLTIGSRFGRRIDPITGKVATHTGLDFPGPQGTPVKATAGGVVVTANWHAGYGRLVELDHGNGVVTRYAHLKAFKVRTGELVKPGQAIGLLGNSGRSTGPHLHFEVWVNGQVRNPASYLRSRAHLAQAP